MNGSPWDDVIVMPRWLDQEHRMIEGHPSGAWICTCGALGRKSASNLYPLFSRHLDREKAKADDFATRHPRAHTYAPRRIWRRSW